MQKRKPIEYYQEQLENCKSSKKRYCLKKVIETYYYKTITELENNGINTDLIITDYKNGISLDELMKKYHIRWRILLHFLFSRNAYKKDNSDKFIIENIDEIRSIVEEGDKEKIKKMIQTLSNITGNSKGTIKFAIGNILYKEDNPLQLDVLRKKHVLTKKERAQLIEYRRTHSTADTAIKFSVSKSSVIRIWKKVMG